MSECHSAVYIFGAPIVGLLVNETKPRCTFFPRGEGPLISVLVCSRGRPDLLVRAIRSCLNNADDPNRIEFLIKLDDDDTATLEKLKQHNFANTTVVVSPRGNGYSDSGIWLNDLAARSRGDWLMVFNDDAVLCKRRWDTLISNFLYLVPVAGLEHCCYVGLPNTHEPNAKFCTFYCVRREFYETMGMVTGSYRADGWISLLTYFFSSGCSRFDDGWIHHKQPDDQTTDESLAARKASLTRTAGEYHQSLEVMQRLVSKILEINRTGWTKEKPPDWSWSLWRPDATAKVVAVFKDDKEFFAVNYKESPVVDEEAGEWHCVSRYDFELGRSVKP